MATVLLADDVDLVREVLRMWAQHRGLEVVGEAADGRNAVELAAQLQPDAVILDQAMPRMTGLEAAPLVRAPAPNASVVLSCAGCGSANEPQARAAGAHAFVEKGGSPADVISTVLELLDRSDLAID
jgi:DNA-binding NarL/FixJ family response regulator